MSQITNIQNYTLDDLQRIEDMCNAKAHEIGLDPGDVLYHLVPPETIYTVASRGIPGRYSHSDFGRSYENMKGGYDRGLGRIYEVIFNTDPAQAYLMNGNSFIAQLLVVAHCLGHSHYFRHNAYFGPTDASFPVRVRAAAERINGYYNRYGRFEVEDFITACNSLSQHARLEKLGKFYEPEPPQAYEPRKWDILDPEGARSRREQARQDRIEFEAGFPRHPERDLLGFIGEHSRHLTDWQRDVISIVRSERDYFAPQMRSQVANEGLAVWTHNKILQELDLDTGAFIEYQKLNAGVVQPHGAQVNPYNLGYEILREIERLAKGEDLTDDDRERWDWVGQANPTEKILDVVETYNDVSLIAEFLTPQVCERAKLFAFERDPHLGRRQIRVTTKEADHIRGLLVKQKSHLGIPVVDIVDADGRNRGELWLEHRYEEGQELDDEYARGTLRLIGGLWGKDTVLHTRDARDPEQECWYHYEHAKHEVQRRIKPPKAD